MLKQDEQKNIVVGSITGHFGIKGWVKVRSFTRPAEQILEFDNWFIQFFSDEGSSGSRQRRPRSAEAVGLERFTLENGWYHGRNLIATLAQVTTREDAEKLIGKEIWVEQSALPPTGPGEYYWTDLIGLTVCNTEGDQLGVVDHLVETGANDVLVVKPVDAGNNEEGKPLVETLVPWIDHVIVRVDLARGETQGGILVDWQADY